jgi:hypothetical protein
LLFAASFPSKPISEMRTDVKLNRKTMLAWLYIYEDVHTYLDYPETGADHPICRSSVLK